MKKAGKTITRTIDQIENRKPTKAERERIKLAQSLPDAQIANRDIPEIDDRTGWVRLHPEHRLHRSLSTLLAKRK